MESERMKEAMRAKQFALERMEMNDFSSALKFAIKAQQLFSDLDNIQQIINVCNVHSSSGDWYKILDVDPTADMAAVRRQYNRMVLSLHPDKNMSPGAAEALQLLIQAKAVLSDVEKRSLYDTTCRAKALADSNKGFSRFQNNNKNPWSVRSSDQAVKNSKSKEVVRKGRRVAKSAPKGKKDGKRVEVTNLGGNSCSGIGPNSKVLEYLDGEYNNFEKLERSKQLFRAGQIWAVYDTLDAMPRFYAFVNGISSEYFKVLITWLEPMPNNEDEVKWLYQGLPSSLGKFKLGYSEIIKDHAVFSHLMLWSKTGNSRKDDVYEIYPKKGETWALFKNWDFDWIKDPERHKVNEFEVVEVLSDYHGEFGVTVGLLGKMQGYASGFSRIKGQGVGWEVIPAKNRLRFSHKIPSYAVTKIDGSNCVTNFFELDPAALSPNYIL